MNPISLTNGLGAKLVLVTGATGWIGFRLIEVLLRGLPGDEAFECPDPGLRVRCLVLPGENTADLKALSPGLEIVTGNIHDPAACRTFCEPARGAVLFHTAGIIHPRNVSEFYRVNVQGTRNLLESASVAGVRRCVVVSSNSPCGCNPHPDHLFDELSPYRPYMNYGRSKMLMELVAREFHDKGLLQTVIIRPPWFYGPNQPARQTLFFKLIRDGKAPIVGSGENLRSMVYVDNLCQGLLLASTRVKAPGNTYWIADERPYAMNQIIVTIETLLSREFGQKCAFRRMKLPGIASDIAQLADAALQRMGLYHQKIHVLSEMNKTIACSVSRARQELGYRPTIALEEGMRRSLAWCRDRGLLS